MIKAVKSLFGKISIKKGLKESKRLKQTVGFNSAKNIGILFTYDSDGSFETVKNFLTQIANEDKKIIALGYIAEPNKFDNKDLLSNINFFNKKELNWFGKPNTEVVNDFINTQFDILINVCSKVVYPIHYINMLSRANFKVGTPEYLDIGSDLIIETNENKDLNYFVEQVLFYLKMIN